MRLIVLLGLTGGVEYHPIHVMWQFGYCRDAFEQSAIPEFFQQYPFGSTAMTIELSCLLRHGVYSTSISMMKGSNYTTEYVAHIRETWPICEIPPGPPLFRDVGSSERAQTGSDN